ncbi:hypothetical protein [Pseudactinotalea terrae]|uniref:hypothetical protein n=1 Tax=Pseudactinotalea terrae TaxID=1743262 RepID=UPI0012E1885C|nr:hypothetical protein [Pseudactinotalea terrae]
MAVDRKFLGTVATIVGTAGPVVTKYLKDHPEILHSVQEAVTKLVAKRTRGPAGMLETIAVLREQVSYIRTSADDEHETQRAVEWSRRLDNLERATHLLRDGGSRREKNAVREKLIALRGEILAGFIAEKADDARTPTIER